MAEAVTVKMRDYRLFMLDLAETDKKTQRVARNEIRKAGEHVRADAALRMSKYDAKSAAGYRTRVRKTGVSVEQTLRRTTGKRPDFGRVINMGRALEPALDDNEQQTLADIDQAIGRVCDQFNRGALVV